MLYVYIYIYKLERYSFRIFEIKLDVKIKATQVSNSISINVTRKLDYTHKKKKDKCYFEIKLIVTVVCEVYLLIHLRAILRYTVTTYHSHSNMQAILAMQKRGISDKNEKRKTRGAKKTRFAKTPTFERIIIALEREHRQCGRVKTSICKFSFTDLLRLKKRKKMLF